MGITSCRSTYLYDTLRPKLIHETNIDSLCELVDILKVEVLGEQLSRRSESLAGLRPTLERILADVHERLTFRARTHIRDEVIIYSWGFVILIKKILLEFICQFKRLPLSETFKLNLFLYCFLLDCWKWWFCSTLFKMFYFTWFYKSCWICFIKRCYIFDILVETLEFFTQNTEKSNGEWDLMLSIHGRMKWMEIICLNIDGTYGLYGLLSFLFEYLVYFSLDYLLSFLFPFLMLSFATFSDSKLFSFGWRFGLPCKAGKICNKWTWNYCCTFSSMSLFTFYVHLTNIYVAWCVSWCQIFLVCFL